MSENFVNFDNLNSRLSRQVKISESDLRIAIIGDIQEYVRKHYKKNIQFSNEVLTDTNKLKDSEYGDFIIEFKRPSISLTQSHREQLFGYLRDSKKESIGVLTNGIEIEIYFFSYEEGKYLRDSSFPEKISKDTLKYIGDVIAKKDNLILTQHNINEIMGVETNKEIIRKMYELLLKSDNPKTELLYKEWQKLYNLSDTYDTLDFETKEPIIKFYEDLLNKKIDSVTSEYKALFTIQTYYSIILKSVIYKLILDKSNEKLVRDKFLKDTFTKLENNQEFRRFGITNLVDGDFFSWYLDEFDEKEFSYFFKKISNVASVETSEINLLFIEFYENIFPFHVRHAMGEYYTPLFLAKEVINNTLKGKDKDRGVVLDPTCGSGIFVITAFNKGYKNVYGIDINPLAVLTSKINYLINNFELKENIEIPIYLGDSTYIPEQVTINGIKSYRYNLITSLDGFSNIPFLFSEDIINNKSFFEILDNLELQIRLKNKQTLFNILKSEKDFHYEELERYYDDLFNTLLQLEEQKLNSIWLKIIGNYLKSGTLNNIDAIVGNPPWVRWSNLPSHYKNLIKDNCRVDGIFSSDTNVGGVDLNIAALITFISMRDRLNINGNLGFILPDTILYNKSFEGFRNMIVSKEDEPEKKFYLNKVIRWNDANEKPFDPVTINFGEFYFSFNESEQIDVYERKDKVYKVAYQIENSFNNHFLIVTREEYKKIMEVIGSNDLVFRSGVSLLKGGHYQLKFKEKISDEVSSFYVYSRIRHRLRPSNQVVELETEIINPFIKTNMINDNEITETEYYCLFPYKYGSREPYSLNELKKKFPKFYSYFLSKPVQESISSSSGYNRRVQATKTDIGIFRVGEYTYSDNYLVTKDNTNSTFAKIGKVKTDWGEEKMPILDGHINFVSRIGDREITSQEVDILFNKFTKEGVKLYVENSSDSRSISGRLYNDISID